MEIQVTTEWKDTPYRATYGKCSIREARTYYKVQRRLNEWLEEQAGEPAANLTGEKWEALGEDIHLAADTWLALAEIITALRTFEIGEVQDEGDEEEGLVPVIKWDVTEFPEEWTAGHTAADSMPYEFFEASLYASRELNPGLFPTSPDFLARANVKRRSTM